MNNQMRTTLRPTDPTSPSTSPINAIVRTEQLSVPRRVVARKPTTTNAGTLARAATTNNSNRRVVARTNTVRIASSDIYRPTDIRQNTPNREDSVYDSELRGQLTSEQRAGTVLSTYPDAQTVPSARCLADYTECMNMYCVRENMAYNRCYCSSKLSQIDAEYKPAIDNLVKQIIKLKNQGEWSESEMNEYWMSTIGKYTGDNSWEKLDSLLDIDWASMESRVRGQNAFATGHEYCVQHLRGCFYMASNLRDAYRSGINNDCAAYESSLQRLKNAAESVIGAYKE